MAELTRDEFLTHMELLRGDIKGVQDRLDDLNGRTRTTEQAIAVLDDRGHPAAWGGGIAGALVTAAEALRWVFGR